MRLARHALVCGIVSLLVHTVAVPTSADTRDNPGKTALALQRRAIARRSSRLTRADQEAETVGQDEPPEVNPEATKYFHEPGEDDLLGHYDIRYFHGIVSYDERTDTLRHLIRSYLLFFRDKGLETWIAHGTLLGWWWNGLMLPWDWDVDTQVSGPTLAYLAENFNQTVHRYALNDVQPAREYLLDVNPWQWERVRGDGMNIIDARWIDVRNGLYIDITGLSETRPVEAPGVWTCKNDHAYNTTDLYPLRQTVFEGVPAMIPYAYDGILREEYHQSALVVMEYEGHRWTPDKEEWVKTEEQALKDAERIRLYEKMEERKKEEAAGKVFE